MQEFKKLVLGDLSVPYYLAAFFFSFLAILLSLYISSKKRDVLSQNTPIKFSWRFLIWDNARRIIVGMIAMFLIYRFCSAFIGRALSMEVATGIGFFVSIGLDQMIGWMKQRMDILQVDRKKIMQNLNV